VEASPGAFLQLFLSRLYFSKKDLSNSLNPAESTSLASEGNYKLKTYLAGVLLKKLSFHISKRYDDGLFSAEKVAAHAIDSYFRRIQDESKIHFFQTLKAEEIG
jgi:hypothetical protein